MTLAAATVTYLGILIGIACAMKGYTLIEIMLGAAMFGVIPMLVSAPICYAMLPSITPTWMIVAAIFLLISAAGWGFLTYSFCIIATMT